MIPLLLSLFGSKIFRIISIVLVVVVIISILGYANYERLRANGLEYEVKSLKQSNSEKDKELSKLSIQINYITSKYNMCESSIEKMKNDYDKKLSEYSSSILKYSGISEKYDTIHIEQNKPTCWNLVNMLNQFSVINKEINDEYNNNKK